MTAQGQQAPPAPRWWFLTPSSAPEGTRLLAEIADPGRGQDAPKGSLGICPHRLGGVHTDHDGGPGTATWKNSSGRSWSNFGNKVNNVVLGYKLKINIHEAIEIHIMAQTSKWGRTDNAKESQSSLCRCSALQEGSRALTLRRGLHRVTSPQGIQDALRGQRNLRVRNTVTGTAWPDG